MLYKVDMLYILPLFFILESLVRAMLEKKKNGYVNEIGDVLLNRVTIFIV